MPKAKSEGIEVGEFRCTVNDDGDEARISDEKNQSNGVLRKKAVNKQLEHSATYTMLLVKKDDKGGDKTDTAVESTGTQSENTQSGGSAKP